MNRFKLVPNDYRLDNPRMKYVKNKLEENNITIELYNEKIIPFLDSLEGTYKTKDKVIRNFFMIPRKFKLNKLSLKKTLEFLLEETPTLEVPIQDIISSQIENISFPTRKNPHINDNFTVSKYKSQKGIIIIGYNENGVEFREAKLDKIKRYVQIIPTQRLSTEGVDNILYKQ